LLQGLINNPEQVIKLALGYFYFRGVGKGKSKLFFIASKNKKAAVNINTVAK